MEIETHDQLSALGHPVRLAVFRLLMRRYPDRVPAGELASALEIKSSTMSTYLAALQRAGLVQQTRVGTSLLYTADMANLRQMFDFLLVDCCRGRPDLCTPDSAKPDQGHDRKRNVLFLCTGNSARSIFAESLLRQIAGDRFNAYSAGTRPNTELNPFALQVLADKGHDTAPLRSKHITEFTAPDAPVFDFVFTVCNTAANEECPPWEGQPLSAHWGMPDPVKTQGSDAEKALAFQHAYGALKRRIEVFTALDMSSLDRLALQSAVDDIGCNQTE